MKKLLLAFALALVATVYSFAQSREGTMYVMPKVGVNLSSMTDVKYSHMRAGAAFGIEAGYELTDNFAVSGALVYSLQGVLFNKEYDGGGIKNDYLNIPVMANYYVLPGLALKAGIQPGILINSRVSNPEFLGGGDINDEELHNKFDFSIPVGVSYEYNNFVLDARYNIGLTKCFKSEWEIGDNKNAVIQITLGYKIGL